MAENISEVQLKLLDEIHNIHKGVDVAWDESKGVASLMRGDLGRAKEGEKQYVLAFNFIEKYGDLFGPHGLSGYIDHLRTRTDGAGWTHIEWQQLCEVEGNEKKRIEVFGSKLIAHISPRGVLTGIQSGCWRDVDVAGGPLVSHDLLQKTLMEKLSGAHSLDTLLGQLKERKIYKFPIISCPRLVLYPGPKRCRLAWAGFSYGVSREDKKGIFVGRFFGDAKTGEIFVFSPTTFSVQGTGMPVTPLGGPYVPRTLEVVKDGAADYRLWDKTGYSGGEGRDIITYNAKGNSSFKNVTRVALALNNNNTATLPVSPDNDDQWDLTASGNSSDAGRLASQQPETDAHYFCHELYAWYRDLAGKNVTAPSKWNRLGWDAGEDCSKFENLGMPPQHIRSIVHTYDPQSGKIRTAASSFNSFYTDDSDIFDTWVSFMLFPDGNPAGNCATENDSFDYPAGSAAIVGHEYQHGITQFSFIDPSGQPGLTIQSVSSTDFDPHPQSWEWALYEGLSDAFGCMFSEQWLVGLDLSRTGMAIRNLAFPRDPSTFDNMPTASSGIGCGIGHHNLDHYGDAYKRNGGICVNAYDRGTILGHLSYLMSGGGIHQRNTRNPELIPVIGLGRNTAAKIWYYALTYHCQSISVDNICCDSACDNSNRIFPTLADGLLSAALELGSSRDSIEYTTTRLALYATGLLPEYEKPYGADATCMRWGRDLGLSPSYVGFDSPMYDSVDLYVSNDDSTPGWNALINVDTPGGGSTGFENHVYCRVRNVGDEIARNVKVKVSYTKASAAPVDWIEIGEISYGSLAIGESKMNDPYLGWSIPPKAQGEYIDHFCLKAEITSDNDVNPYNNIVQSNITYAAYDPLNPQFFHFMVGNPTKETIPVQIKVDSELPRGWETHVDQMEIKKLEPGEQHMARIHIGMPAGADKKLEPPFNGEVVGEVFGMLTGQFKGVLSDTRMAREKLTGRIALNLEMIGSFIGTFEGKLDAHTGDLNGRATGTYCCPGGAQNKRMCVGVKACLRPLRRISISQTVGDKTIGGLTIQVQVPMPPHRYARALPPTDTYVMPEKKQKRPARKIKAIVPG